MVMRLSGRTCSVVPSKNVISAAAPAPVRTRSLLRSTMERSALTHSKVPTVLTLTLPSRVVKRAVVTVAGGASVGVVAGALRVQKWYPTPPPTSTTTRIAMKMDRYETVNQSTMSSWSLTRLRSGAAIP